MQRELYHNWAQHRRSIILVVLSDTRLVRCWVAILPILYRTADTVCPLSDIVAFTVFALQRMSYRRLSDVVVFIVHEDVAELKICILLPFNQHELEVQRRSAKII